MNPEQERTPIDRPCGLYQEYVRGQIKKILLSEEILVNILVDWYGQPTFFKQSWEEFWAPVTSQLSPRGLQILDDLKTAHRQYISVVVTGAGLPDQRIEVRPMTTLIHKQSLQELS